MILIPLDLCSLGQEGVLKLADSSTGAVVSKFNSFKYVYFISWLRSVLRQQSCE